MTAEPDLFHDFVGIQGRGTIALPAALRRRYRLDDPGAQVEITERADGVLEIRPTVAVPASQAWFWTGEWQAREREVEEDLAAGRVRTFDGPAEFLAGLDELDAQADEPGKA